MTTKDEIDSAVRKLEDLRRRQEAEEREETARRQLPMRAVAKAAHDILCRWNHTDGCGWGYEEGRDPNSDVCWNGWAHKRWLDAVERIVKAERWPSAMTTEELGALIDRMRDVLTVHRDALLVLEELRRLA